METKKQKYPLINMGTSLMLVIFIILCFIIFSTLSLSSSLRDRNYSQKAIEKTEDYYQASSLAQRKLKEIDEYLIHHQDLSSIKDIKIEGNLLSFQEKIDKNQELEIQLQLTNDQNRYKIIKWEKHSSTKWENKTSLPLIGND